MAGGEGCRDERRGSSASEVGTDDGTAKKQNKTKTAHDNRSHFLSLMNSKSQQTVFIVAKCLVCAFNLRKKQNKTKQKLPMIIEVIS